MAKHERIQTSDKIVTALNILRDNSTTDTSEIMTKPQIAEHIHEVYRIQSELARMAIGGSNLETLSIKLDQDEDVKIYQRKEYSDYDILSIQPNLFNVLDTPYPSKKNINLVFYTGCGGRVAVLNNLGSSGKGSQRLEGVDKLTPIMLAEYTTSEKEQRLDLTGFTYVNNFGVTVSKDKTGILTTHIKSRER